MSDHEKIRDTDTAAARDARFVRLVIAALVGAFLVYVGWKAYHIRTAFKAWDDQSEVHVPKDRRLMPAK